MKISDMDRAIEIRENLNDIRSFEKGDDIFQMDKAHYKLFKNVYYDDYRIDIPYKYVKPSLDKWEADLRAELKALGVDDEC